MNTSDLQIITYCEDCGALPDKDQPITALCDQCNGHMAQNKGWYETKQRRGIAGIWQYDEIVGYGLC